MENFFDSKMKLYDKLKADDVVLPKISASCVTIEALINISKPEYFIFYHSDIKKANEVCLITPPKYAFEILKRHVKNLSNKILPFKTCPDSDYLCNLAQYIDLENKLHLVDSNTPSSKIHKKTHKLKKQIQKSINQKRYNFAEILRLKSKRAELKKKQEEIISLLKQPSIITEKVNECFACVNIDPSTRLKSYQSCIDNLQEATHEFKQVLNKQHHIAETELIDFKDQTENDFIKLLQFANKRIAFTKRENSSEHNTETTPLYNINIKLQKMREARTLKQHIDVSNSNQTSPNKAANNINKAANCIKEPGAPQNDIADEKTKKYNEDDHE